LRVDDMSWYGHLMGTRVDKKRQGVQVGNICRVVEGLLYMLLCGRLVSLMKYTALLLRMR
jgi:hypothetical protein